MKEPEEEGPPRPSLKLLPLADDPKGRKKRRPAREPKSDEARETGHDRPQDED
jgi:hypothetical protein